MKKNMRLHLGFLFIALCVSTSAIPASFDCNSTTTIVEARICSDRLLSELDDRMGALYREAIKISNAKESLRKEQSGWLKSVRDPCEVKKNTLVRYECLRDAYETRNSHLFKLIETSRSQDISKYVGRYRKPTQRLCIKSGEGNKEVETVCDAEDSLTIGVDTNRAINIEVEALGARTVCAAGGPAIRIGNTLVHQFEEKPNPPCILVLYLDPDGVLIMDRNGRKCFCGSDTNIDGYKFYLREKTNSAK